MIRIPFHLKCGMKKKRKKTPNAYDLLKFKKNIALSIRVSRENYRKLVAMKWHDKERSLRYFLFTIILL